MTAVMKKGRIVGRLEERPQFRDLADWSRTTPEQLVATHLAKTSNTARGYREDLEALSRWMEAGSVAEAARRIVDNGRPAAKRLLIAWVNDMRAARLSASTIRRRVASIKSLISTASDPDLEIITWQVGKIKNLPSPGRVRDCRGPARTDVDRMLTLCQQRTDPKGRRDEAALSLLYYHAMRASEVLSVRRQDVDLDARPAVLRFVSKTESGRITLRLCNGVAEILRRWIDVRGDEPGPLFARCPRWGRGVLTKPLSYWGLRGMVRDLGSSVGIRCWPHGLRHAGITHLATLTADSPIWGTALSRHKDVRTWAGYQDHAVSHVAAAEVLWRRQVVVHDPHGADNSCC